MKLKRNDGENAKAVREQMFLSRLGWRYKSEPGMVESPISNLQSASIATPVLGVWLKLKILLKKLKNNSFF